ncbi:MAG: acyl-CoA thioesterase [Proteobacteria bacterium]|nr:acyl-CoA thioesterase [Pseudomonadota bacterium]
MRVDIVNKEPETDVVIRFQDCDPFGHLNNARYIDYFINAREDHLADQYDLDIYERQKRYQTNWVIAKTKIAYLAPVFFREKVLIRTRLLRYTDRSLLMEGVMTDMTRKDLKSATWIEFRHFDLVRKTQIRHSGPLMDLFEKMAVRRFNTSDFDARVKALLCSDDK